MPDRKVAIVTAGGSGMGAAAARQLAHDGFDIAVLSSSGRGEALAKELGGLGVTGSNQANDALKRLVDATLDRWGRIDVLVNSAGHGPRAPVLELTDEQWHAGLDVYLMNVIRPTRLVTPAMVRQRSGVIINISTAWAFEPSSMFPTSAVVRAGLAAFTKIFADEYAADNVRMNNVLPGFTDTDRLREIFAARARASGKSSDDLAREAMARVPAGRFGAPEEIAALVAFLASPAGAYITMSRT